MLYDVLSGKNSFLSYVLLGLLIILTTVCDYLNFGNENIVYNIIGKLLIISISFSLNKTLIKHKFIATSSLSPMILCAIGLLSIPNITNYLFQLMGLFLVVQFVKKISLLYNTTQSYREVFELGLITGLLYFIDSTYLILVPVLLIGLSLVKTFEWRDFIIPIIGFCLIQYFHLSINYVFYSNTNLKVVFDLNISIHQLIPKFNKNDVFYFPLLFLFGISYLYNFNKLETQSIRHRLHNKLWLWVAFSLILFSFLTVTEKKIDQLIIYSSLPFAVLASILLTNITKKWVINLIGLILLISCVANHLRIINLIDF